MAMNFYRQCTLRSGNTETVAWIEEHGAKVGNRITLKDAEDPTLQWTVTTVSRTRMSHDQVRDQEHRHTKWHEQVDI